jgi:signal transduction histidine kinase
MALAPALALPGLMLFIRRAPGTFDLLEARASFLGWPREAWLEPGFLVSRMDGADALTDDCEVRLRRADGSWAWVHLCFDGDQGAIDDVTARRRRESIGALAGGVAHELNSPLQFVKDNLSFIAEVLAEVQHPDAEDALAAVADSKKGLDRLTAMARAMRDCSTPEGVIGADVNKAVQAVLAFARHEYKYGGEAEVSLGALPLVQCHAGELHHGVLELLLSAARAKGRIAVSTRVDGAQVVVQVGQGELRL